MEEVVSRNPKVMIGALVFQGTRVPVEGSVQHLAAGDSLDGFLEGFPGVSREQAFAYLEVTPEAVDVPRAHFKTSGATETGGEGQ